MFVYYGERIPHFFIDREQIPHYSIPISVFQKSIGS